MDIGSLKAQVESAAIDAIWRDTRVFGWISAGGNMDDILGNHVFIYSQKEVLDAGLGGIAFEQRWQNVIDSPSRFGPQENFDSRLANHRTYSWHEVAAS